MLTSPGQVAAPLGAHQTPLGALVHAPERQFAAIAESWLRAGAASFSIWSAGLQLARWPRDIDDRPGMSAPIRASGVILGELWVTGLDNPDLRHRLAADADLLGQLAALESDLVAMTGEIVDIQDQLLALYALSQSLRSHLTVEGTLGALVDAAARLVQARHAFAALALATGESQALVTYPRDLAARRQEQLGRFFALAHRDGREILLNEPAQVGALGIPDLGGNVLFVPIEVQGTVAAGLALFERPGGFTAPDRKLARALADLAGAQLENVLLHEEMLRQARMKAEFDIAAGIQRQLLPKRTPRPPGIEIAGRTLPAFQIGGDFYDYISRTEPCLTFVVGDVTGKGMPAALLMTICQRVIHMAAKFVPIPSPAGLMKRASEDLYDTFTEVGMFATLFVGQYDPVTRRLAYANAGHSPVIHCPLGGPARLLEADGTAMGVLPETFCENQTLDFAPGDLLLVASDGFSEACDATGAMFGYDQLLRLAEEVAGQTAAEIGDAFFGAVARFASGHAQDDDQTLVVIKGVAS